MTYSIKSILLIITIAVSTMGIGQEYELSSSNKRAIKYYNGAISHYNTGDIQSALDALAKAINTDNNFLEAWLLRGDLFSDKNQVFDAIYCYEKAVSIDSVSFPPVYYFLGNLYYQNSQYDKSVSSLKTYLSFQDLRPEMVELAFSKLEMAEIAYDLIENPVETEPINIGAPVNNANDQYINYVSPENNHMIFTNRSPGDGRRDFIEQLYYSKTSDSSWSEPRKINLKWRDDRYNMGTINFSTDGRVMYFTGCYWPDGFGSCDIYQSESIGDEWLPPTNMGESINTSGWDSQPIISSDGKRLFFSSKRTGGKGGSDIWMSLLLKNGSWSPPVNLGDSINTAGNEMAPFLHPDGKTMFFASTGHPGLGGFDLFVSRQDEMGRWSKAVNIGYPTNSKYNEIIIFSSLDGKHNWISSDRPGSSGKYDIYYFPTYEKIRPQKIMYVLGKVLDKETNEPLKAKVEITNLKSSEIINSTESDSLSGEFLIVLFPGVEYAFNISKQGYLFYSENINLVDTIGIESVKKTFLLSPIRSGVQFTMNNIFFEFNKSDLLSTSFIELNKLLEILKNSDFSIDIVGHTDGIGNYDYNMNLSLKRAEAVGNYLIENGINNIRLNYIAKGSSQPIDSNDTEEGRARNRRTEVVVR